MSLFKDYNLSLEVLKSIDDLGYKKMTEVQEKVIGEALLNKDLIVKAETGSGKTAAFGIPLCERLNFESEDKALILAPTRELAVQISEDLKNLGRYKRLKVVTIIGKESFKEQEKALKGKFNIVVGTPGRTLDHLDKKTLDGKAIKTLIIDEADEMFNMGFINEVENLCSKINKNRVTMLFSATVPEKIESLTKKHMNRPITINCNKKGVVTENITHGLLVVEGSEKLQKVDEILLSEMPKRAIVFCRTKDNVETAFNYFKKKGYSIDKLHGDMLQKERNKRMEEFREGRFKILIATDIAARGLDIEEVTHVINIDIPVEKESYVHRIGRCGRGGQKGESITIMTPFEKKYLDRIEEYIGFNIEEYKEKEIANKEEAIEFLRKTPERRKDKKKDIKGVTKIYLNGGKKKKIRILDIVGTICSINGVEKDDIGVIDIKDNGSTVEIFNNKGNMVIKELATKTIKGKKLRVEKQRRS
ncbi:MAG: DEAD/DEAH box helicase [Clostridium sp.]